MSLGEHGCSGFCLDWVGFCLCMAGRGIEAAHWAFAYLFGLGT